MRNSLLLFLLFCASLSFAQQKKVLIIGIDGCRQDALQTANTPNIDALIETAVYSYDALTHAPTWSATGWSSMLTGVWETKHGAYSNAFENTNFDEYPHFFSRVEAHSNELSTISICHWAPINEQILAVSDIEINTDTDAEVSEQATGFLSGLDPDVMFLHFDDVDHAGHSHGFFPDVPEYIESIETTDTFVGEVITAMKSRSTYAEEDWLVIVSTDHGGNTGHGGASFEERNIFIIASRENEEQIELAKEENEVVVSSAINFNGSNQFFKPADSTPFQFGENQDFSIEIRVNAPNLDGDAAFISNKDWNSGLNPGWIISTPFSDNSRWKVNIADGNSRVDIDGSTIGDGFWHHLTLTCDRDGLMKIYQNGEFLGDADISQIGAIDTAFDLNIGQDGTGNYPTIYQGNMSEIRIWNTVLSPETVRNYACTTLDENHPEYAHLLAYFPANEGDGNTLTNIVDPTNNANINEGEASWGTEPTTLTCIDFDDTPRMPDIAVTALTHLCIPIDALWNLDGTSLIDVCEPDATEIQNSFGMKVLPNPAKEQVYIQFETAALRQIRLVNVQGELVFETISNAIDKTIMLEKISRGYYFLEVQEGQKIAREQLIILN